MPGTKKEKGTETLSKTMQAAPTRLVCSMSHFKQADHDQFVWLCEQRKREEANNAQLVHTETISAAREQLHSIDDFSSMEKSDEKNRSAF